MYRSVHNVRKELDSYIDKISFNSEDRDMLTGSQTVLSNMIEHFNNKSYDSICMQEYCELVVEELKFMLKTLRNPYVMIPIMFTPKPIGSRDIEDFKSVLRDMATETMFQYAEDHENNI